MGSEGAVLECALKELRGLQCGQWSERKDYGFTHRNLRWMVETTAYPSPLPALPPAHIVPPQKDFPEPPRAKGREDLSPIAESSHTQYPGAVFMKCCTPKSFHTSNWSVFDSTLETSPPQTGDGGEAHLQMMVILIKCPENL